MLQDLNTIFSGAVAADGMRTGQPIAATTLSTNILDLRQPGAAPAVKDEGLLGAGLWLVVYATQTFSGSLTSLQVTLESDSTSNLATAPVVHVSKTIAAASLVAGAAVLRMPLPADDYKRYVALRYTPNGGSVGQGAVLAFLSHVPPSNTLFRSSFALDA